jgi:hypothetical protein
MMSPLIPIEPVMIWQRQRRIDPMDEMASSPWDANGDPGAYALQLAPPIPPRQDRVEISLEALRLLNQEQNDQQSPSS